MTKPIPSSAFATSTLLADMPIPRSIIGAPRAEAGTAEMLNKIKAAVEDMRSRNDGRISAIEAHVDELARAGATGLLNSGAGTNRQDDPEYSALFASYFRRGTSEDDLRTAQGNGDRARILASMTSGTPADGGYLAPTEWDRRIQQKQMLTSPMRRLAQVRTTTVGAYSTVWNSDAWGSGWVGETAERPQTSNPTLSSIVFGHGEIYAMPAVSQRLLDDAQFNMEQWLADSVDREFGKQEGIAFISGNGTNKPFGLLQYVTGGAAATQHPGGTLGITVSGSAGAVTVDQLIQIAYDLGAPYRQNATWLMNSQTAAQIAKLKDGEGNLIWRESFIVGQPATLLGRPVEIDENMPDIAAGSTPIAFGDFYSGYVINDRIGTRILRDPYTNKPFVMFYVTKRVGGGVLDPNAIRLMKIAAA